MKSHTLRKTITDLRTKYLRRENWFNILLHLYIALFVFTMFNREYLFFGFDPRFVQLPLGVIILSINFFSKQYRPAKKKNDAIGRAMITFYIYAFISNIAWLWNGLEPNMPKLINELILLANVFIGLLVFYLNNKRLNSNFVINSAIVSCFILAVSILLVHQGLTLAQISGSPDAHYISRTVKNVNNNNLFGEGFRCAGYASDPNYATILLLIGIVCMLKAHWKKKYKLLPVILFASCMGLSFSRTVFLAIFVCGAYVLALSYFKIKTLTKIRLNRLFILGLILAAIVVPLIPAITGQLPQTLSTRTVMWQSASQLFWHSPLFGNGITSFRSHFLAAGHWFVQTHSTYWQIIAELGIIGIILYYSIITKALNLSLKKPLNFFLSLVFLIWIFTCETIALPLSMMVYYIIDNGILDETSRQKQKTALFLVNSLKQGGAEKVCLNLADELTQENYKVDFLTLQPSQQTPKSYTIYNLKCNAKNNLLRLLQLLLAIPTANDYISVHEVAYGNYDLTTSHLPVSNILTRLTIVRRQAIYVLHTTMDSYGFCPQPIYRKIVQLFFRNYKVVAVSKGLQQELVHKYHLSRKNTRVIYNPIIFPEIKKASKSKCPLEEPYFLHVGRFEPGKNQALMLQIFQSGGFDQKYHLVFCGTGSTLHAVKKQAETMELSEKVHFMGHQDNIYTWMHHAEILISTSDREAFPMNLVEALACGTKVVASDCDFGPREILLGEYSNFLVTPIDDAQQYIKTIRSALKKYPKGPNPILHKLQPTAIVQKYIAFYNK